MDYDVVPSRPQGKHIIFEKIGKTEVKIEMNENPSSTEVFVLNHEKRWIKQVSSTGSRETEPRSTST